LAHEENIRAIMAPQAAVSQKYSIPRSPEASQSHNGARAHPNGEALVRQPLSTPYFFARQATLSHLAIERLRAQLLTSARAVFIGRNKLCGRLAKG
jgi:hypothetical protein